MESELKINFIYNGEESLLDFLNLIKFDMGDRLDKHTWSGEVKIGDLVYSARDCTTSILAIIAISLLEEKGIPIKINLWCEP